MKIAILAPFYPYRGGLAQFNARLFAELGKSNEVKAFSFTCLYPNFLFPGKTQYVTADDTAVVVENERVLNSVSPFSYLRTAKRINEYHPDVLIIPYWMSFFAPAFGVVVRLINKKIKVVSLVHNAFPHERRFFDRAFAKFFFKKCDSFIVMSDIVKNDLLTLVPNAKILERPHPIYDHYPERIDREDACEELGIDKEKHTLLFFGLIRSYKGLDLLIEAMGKLDDSYQLIIAGESYSDFKAYEQLIELSKNKQNIKVFQHYIPDEMVSKLFSAADVLVLPYRSATQSGVVAVAYQMGTPILATDVGAIGEAVRESETGIVIPEVSADSIAKSIQRFFERDYQHEYKDALQKEKSRLSWSSFVHAVETFIS